MAKPVAFSKAAADRIARSVLRTERSGGNSYRLPLNFRAQESSEWQYFRLTTPLTPCEICQAKKVVAVCCGVDDVRMDLIDPPSDEDLSATLYDHLGSARLFNIGEGNKRNKPIPAGTYALARWVSFANQDTLEECGQSTGVWELVGFLPCAAAACSSASSSSSSSVSSSSVSSSSVSSSSASSASSASSSGSSESESESESESASDSASQPSFSFSASSASSDSQSSESESSDSQSSESESESSGSQSSWRSSASGSDGCADCGDGGTKVVTDVECVDGELVITKTKIDAAECCGGGGSGDDEDGPILNL